MFRRPPAPILALACGAFVASLVAACGGKTIGTDDSPAAKGDPTDPCPGCTAPQAPQASASPMPAPEPANPAAVSSARAALDGQSFRVKELQIGGYAPGMAPPEWRERIVGADIKVCFRDQGRVTYCECSEFLPASAQNRVDPTDNCVGPVRCLEGSFTFTASGKLRMEVPGSQLTFALRASSTYDPGAGIVTVRPEGTYVEALVTIGQALLEPTNGCP